MNRLRSSRQRYLSFVKDYKQRRLDDANDANGAAGKPKPSGDPAKTGAEPAAPESAGKRKSSRIPKGNVYLKTALVEAAHAAARTKGTYLRDKFHRLKARV